ncbi:MAG: hypothetical protein ACSHX9_05815 [Luteolibacter sp.]
MRQNFQLFLLAFWCLLLPLKAQTQIDWFCEQNATNFAANGTSAMDGSFRFELGVFTGSFVPTTENISEWSANWNGAQRTSYLEGIKRFTSSLSVASTAAPFTAGKAVYVWGFKGDPVAGEWILFRAASWTWPSVVTGPPSFLLWDAKDATTVIGTINSTGSPFLMQAAAVVNALPPVTTFAQWQTDELSGETLIEAHQDADGDGTANILEFIFGTSPKIANSSPLASANLLSLSNEQYLQLVIPRRADRPANLAVEVSDNLSQWDSGSGHTATVSSSNASLIVRDLTPISPTVPKRFIRINVTP